MNRQELTKELMDYATAQTIAIEKLESVQEKLLEIHLFELRKELGIGSNRKEQKRIDKILAEHKKVFYNGINKEIKSKNKLLKHFDSFVNVNELNEKVDNMYIYLE